MKEISILFRINEQEEIEEIAIFNPYACCSFST